MQHQHDYNVQTNIHNHNMYMYICTNTHPRWPPQTNPTHLWWAHISLCGKKSLAGNMYMLGETLRLALPSHAHTQFNLCPTRACLPDTCISQGTCSCDETCNVHATLSKVLSKQHQKINNNMNASLTHSLQLLLLPDLPACPIILVAP